MNDAADWLPPLVLFEEYNGNWDRYIHALYSIFQNDFMDSTLIFEKRRIRFKRYPMEQGKEATFWHLISKGSVEKERVPDLRRCERIAWPRPMIESIDTGFIFLWCNYRQREKRIVISLKDFSYIVILADRGEYVLLWTAYFVEQQHQRIKLQKEYEAYVGLKS